MYSFVAGNKRLYTLTRGLFYLIIPIYYASMVYQASLFRPCSHFYLVILSQQQCSCFPHQFHVSQSIMISICEDETQFPNARSNF